MPKRQLAQRQQRPRTHARRRRVASPIEQCAQLRPTFAEVTAQPPEAPDRARQAQPAPVRIAQPMLSFEDRAQVAMLGFESIQPHDLLRPGQLGRGLFDERQVVLGVRVRARPPARRALRDALARTGSRARAVGSGARRPRAVRPRPATCRPGARAHPARPRWQARQSRRRFRQLRASTVRRRSPTDETGGVRAPRAGRGSSPAWRAASAAGGAVRLPCVRRRKQSSSRSTICATESVPTHAAASWIASGIPSSRAQISATAAIFARR